MANHNLPTLTSTYTNFVSELDGRLDDLAVGMDPAVTTVTNPPANSIRWNSADKKWEKWSGTAWNELSANYAINLQGPSTVSANSTGDALRITQTGTGNAFVVEDSSSPDSTPFVIGADGRVIIGDTAGFLPFNYHLQHHGDGVDIGFGVTNATDGTRAPNIRIGKSRGTRATRSPVLNGDETGGLRFYGFDGANWQASSQIFGFIDNTPGAGSMPGRLVFSTTPSGSGTPVDRLSIDSAGHARFTASTTGVSGIELYRDSSTDSSRLFFTSTGNVGFGIYKSVDGLRFTYGAIVGSNSGTTGLRMTSDGGLQISKTAVTSPAASDGNVFSGTYTPTLTNSAGISQSTAYICLYMRVGNVVTVSGILGVTTTGTGSQTVGISLPIASTFTGIIQAGGSGTFYGATFRGTAAAIYADSANARATFNFNSPSAASGQAATFTFTYRIL